MEDIIKKELKNYTDIYWKIGTYLFNIIEGCINGYKLKHL